MSHSETSSRLWRICVDVPEGCIDDSLFTAVADAVHDWEPDDRDGWDAQVYASVVPDLCACQTQMVICECGHDRCPSCDPECSIDDEFEPTGWWKVVGLDGNLWCETSNYQEARNSMRDGDELWRMYEKIEKEWRKV